MEKITNEQKAREICGCGNCHHNFKGSECLKYTGILCCLKPCFKTTLEAMEWKDEQHKQEKQQLQWKFMSEKSNEVQQQTRFLLYKNNGDLEYLPISDGDTITSTGNGLCVMKVDGSYKYCNMITIEDNQIDIKGLCDDFTDRYEPKSNGEMI